MARPRFAPTEETRRQTKMLAGLGISHDSIAELIGIAPKTLRKHFRRELSRGVTEANAQVAKALLQAAIGGNVPAGTFWLKHRAGWREQGPEGQRAPVAIPDFIVHGPAAKPDVTSPPDVPSHPDELDKAA